MANVLIDLKADRNATLAMMLEAQASREAANRPDPRQDDLLRRAQNGDWTWLAMPGKQAIPPEPDQRPTPEAEVASHRSDWATDAQLRFLHVLFSKVDRLAGSSLTEATADERAKLSRKAASALIEKTQAQVEKLEQARGARFIGDPQVYQPAKVQKAAVASSPVVPEGRYAIRGRDGTVDFYKVDHGKAGGRWDGYVFVSLLIGAPGSFAEQRIGREASTSVIGRVLAAGIEDSARLYGEKTRTCGNCGADLSDPQSRAAGYGETCAGNRGYWYPTRAEALEILDED